MCKFVQVIYKPSLNLFSNLHYIPQIKSCYKKYAKYLQDDFALFHEDIYLYLEQSFPFFWVVLNYQNEFMGFVMLDNLCGGKNILYSAELSVCLDKQGWGDFARYSAKIFLKKCFDELGLYKIKAQVFPDNFRTSSILKSSGFKYESTLKSETLRFGKPQDINIYALYRDYYYCKR